jgi:hypothetical protein
MFGERPYSPPTPNEVMPVMGTSLFYLGVLIFRWPAWICIVIGGFLYTYVTYLLMVGAEALDRWLAQAYYAIFSLFGGALILALGHWLTFASTALIVQHLLGSVTITTEVEHFISVHTSAVAALSLYAAAPALIGMRWERGTSISRLISQTANGFSEFGKPVAVSVGRAFSMLGIIFIAAPIAALLPLGPHFGAFSIAYVALMAIGIPYLRSHTRVRAGTSLSVMLTRKS